MENQQVSRTYNQGVIKEMNSQRIKSLKSSGCFRRLLLLVLVLSLVAPVSAQESDPIPVRFAGRVQSIVNGTLVIDQIRIDTTTASVNAVLQNGNLVIVDGLLQADGTIIARAILTYIEPENAHQPPTTVPSEPTTHPVTDISISGQIESLNGNLLSVNGQQLTVSADNPILASLRVGDQVIIAGQQFADHIAVVTITKLDATPSSVGIEGIVQAIDKDMVTVNDQQVQFPHHDPLLTTLQVGDSLRVEGNYTQTKKGPVFEVTQATVTAHLQENSSDQSDNGNNDNGQGMGKGMGG
ncbi:MAG: DUF5666 domain-containing protein [Chloroflexota bacterium]